MIIPLYPLCFRRKDAVLLSVGSVVGLWDRSRYHFTNRKSILFSDLDRFLLIGRRTQLRWNWPDSFQEIF
jgi:hypothetical protein